MSSRRICMVTTFYPPRSFGGDGIAVQSLARALVRRGHEVTVICDDDAFRTLSGIRGDAPDEVEDGVVVHRLRSKLGAFDVVHYHNVSLVGGPGVLTYGDAVKLYTAHEHWLVCPTHVLWRYGKEPCPARDCLRCQLSYHRPPQLWRHTGLLESHLSLVDAFIAVSRFSRAKHQEFGFSRDMEIIPGFVRDPGPPRRAASPRGERPYFLFVGRIEKLKGLDDVVQRFATFGDADLRIAGEGSARASLELQAAGNPRVQFLGFQSGEALARLYEGATAMIASSRGFETFGMTVVEAYSKGIPVLARRQGSYLELVDGSGAGATFGDADELEVEMRRMLSDAENHDRMRARAYELFRTSYSEDAVLPRYLELIDRLMLAPRSHSPSARTPEPVHA
jgi:glycosyltransferase involved in cell wall biosynthesis